MQRHILVPLDGSVLAETILPQVVRLAHATHSTLTLLRAVPLPILADPLVGTLPPTSGVYDAWEGEAAAAQEYLAGVIERLQDDALTIHTVVVEGEPAQAIVSYARERAEGLLIAMATHGRSGVRRWIFGSVAERLLHTAPVPLLLARPPADTPVTVEIAAPYRLILVPLDGSPLAEQALLPAQQLAAALNATLLLTAVVPLRDERAAAKGGVVPPHLSSAQHEEQARLHQYLKTIAAGLEAGGLRVETQVFYGHPAEAILRASDYAEADLIVMATHGRTGLSQLWLGSVTLKVVQGTHCPALVVRAQPVAERVADPVAESAGQVPKAVLTG